VSAGSEHDKLSLENQVELEALCNMLRLARGFVLGFARVNHPGLQRRLIDEIRCRCPEKQILELTLDPRSGAGIVAQCAEATGSSHPDALFVHGLESVLDLTERQSPAMTLFNLNRDYAANRFPIPVVFWAPDFAMAEFARQAPDFWSVRSGTYCFTGDDAEARTSLGRLEEGFDWSLSRKEKLERGRILEHILAELEADPAVEPHTLARVLSLLADTERFRSRPDREERYLRQARDHYERAGDRGGEANCIQALGDVERMLARYEEARSAYEEALPIYREVRARLGEANCIQALGDVERMLARYEEARSAYEEALPIYREVRARLGEAATLSSIARLLDRRGNPREASLSFAEAARIFEAIGRPDLARRELAERDRLGPARQSG
jgi:tetratricopeptide (TPR) repeat protein